MITLYCSFQNSSKSVRSIVPTRVDHKRALKLFTKINLCPYRQPIFMSVGKRIQLDWLLRVEDFTRRGEIYVVEPVNRKFRRTNIDHFCAFVTFAQIALNTFVIVFN